MRKSLLILFCLSISYYLMAQETLKQKEIGLIFNNLDNFGLTYRTGTEQSLWRFNTLFLSGNNFQEAGDNLSTNRSNFGFGIKIGKEYRKEIVKNIELRFGADISFGYSQSKSEYDSKTSVDYRLYEFVTYQPGLNLVFGFNYLLGDNLMIGAELLPGFSYTGGESVDRINEEVLESDISGFNYGLSNNSVLLSLAYKF